MRRALIAIAVATQVGPAAGEVRPSTGDMSCEAARVLVQARSAVVFSTGPNTYQRFFATPLFCSILDMTAVQQTVPTRDSPACEIGYTCTREDRD